MLAARRFVLVLTALALSAALTACGGGEAEQAKVFQEFLQTRILDKKGIRMPRPTDEQRAAFGRFAADYDVIVKFNDALTESVGSKLPGVMQRGNITSVAQLVDRKADVEAARNALTSLSATMEAALSEANAAQAKMTQPPELKAVYDQAFARLVTQPAGVVKTVWPAVDKGLKATIDFAQFLIDHRAKFEFNGPMAQTKDAKLLEQFNAHVEEMRGSASGIRDAQNELRKLVYGE